MNEQKQTGLIGIRDVAEAAGVANVTVSNILNKTPISYKESTRKRVIQAARKLGYRPNLLARSMRTQKTHVIGIIVPDLLGTYFSSLAYAAELRLGEEGYQVLLCQSHGSNELHEKLIHTLCQRNVDGLLVAVIDSKVHEKTYESIGTGRIPILLCDSNIEALPASMPLVESDQPALTRLAVEHLWELGHRDIFFFSGDSNLCSARERLDGFLDSMRTFGVRSPENYVVEAGYREQTGEKAFDALIESGQEFTGIVAPNMFCGYGILSKSEELNLKIPEDFSLVVIGGGRDAFRMGLTDVDQQPQLIGTRMASVLLNAIHAKEASSRNKAKSDEVVPESLHFKVEPVLNIRRSTQAVHSEV